MMERLAFTGGPSPDAEESVPRSTAVISHPDAVDADTEKQDSLAFKGLLAFMLVLFFRPQDTFPFLEPLRLGYITAAFALSALVGARLARGAPVTRLTPELVAVLALAFVMLATAPFSVWPGGAVGVFTDLYWKVILVLALMVNTLTTRARFKRLVSVVVLGTSYIAIRAVIDYVRGVNLVEDGRVAGAVGGLFGNPNDMALNMVTFLPLAAALAVLSGRPLVRLIALVGLPAIAAAIIFSKSRSGTIGLTAMLMVLLYKVSRLRPGLVILGLALCLATVPLLPASFTARMSSIFKPEEDDTGSRQARTLLMREGYQAFLDHPLVGIGAGQFTNYQPERRDEPWRETHNAVLQVASELGIAGLVVFLILAGCGFAAVSRGTAALKRMRQLALHGAGTSGEFELFGAALVASLTGWLAAAMFASVAYYWTLYLVLGLAAAFRDIMSREAAMMNAGRVPVGLRAA